MTAIYAYTAAPEMILRIEDNSFIPADAGNTDYQGYLAYVEQGGLTDPYVPPAPAVPTSASKLGLKRAFSEMGIWANVKAAIASDEDVQEEWDLAINVKRTDPLVQMMITMLSFTEDQVDQLLIRASALVD